jgi:predicted glycosyltransferase involved in capsule biosynthesis
VIYAGKASSDVITKGKKIDKTVTADKIVTYFEGGSIACRTDTFWRIGGFVEGYWGYGCEDCDFYFRLSRGARWFENRVIDFIHLYHSRTPGWVRLHDANKEFEKQLAVLSVEERIAKQLKYFKNGPYWKIINSALARK